ncbi:CAZyme family AA16 [Penicillium roqueforti]|uniref:Chitin-binding, domain 3 n=1 Tax=Penicillium roqueforti (strain FM164) TaxID=1365484 RepID=W6QDJ7_PENRF|nr:CAZyme family AA16 [Penicillium roqueforti]CDM34753.1 Chitin-binding, domain 3 [Penicillium roqueforti FM164]KAI2678153.1 CAZyme family AA16 [Penicillium roqueforti]KAI2686498.1 CAZyme family AA16 [Penicillium roqueforti]KAI2704516.1 CAZyme family AA16 [Penicillium roqueforti]
MKSFTPALAFASIISLVNAHGFVTSPAAREPGTAMGAACGQQVLSNQESDKYGNIQGELQVAATQTDYNAAECDIWLCKGYKFADNQANIQSYTAGEEVAFTVDIRAPHTGVANVSVVQTSSNTVIGSPLISWDVYASVATGVTANETSFSVTIPDDLGSQCATAGDCVLQWYWYAESIDQTYESCIDFTLGGSGSSAVASTSSTSSTSSISSTSSSTVVAATTTPTAAVVETPTTAAVQPTTSSTTVAAVVKTPTTAAVQSTTPSITVAAQPTTSTTTVAAQPTTFATTVRQSTTSAAAQVPTTSADASATTSAVSIPTGSAADVLSWIESLLGNLVGN